MKLIDSIKAVATGQREPILDPLISIKYTADKVPEYQPKYKREYSITVTLGASEWIAEDVIKVSRGDVIDYAVESMKHKIVDLVYGEIRNDLIKLKMDLRHECDMNQYSPTIVRLDSIIAKITL